VPPFPPFPDFRVPLFSRCIARSTLLPAAFPYLVDELFFVVVFLADDFFLVAIEVSSFFLKVFNWCGKPAASLRKYEYRAGSRKKESGQSCTSKRS
jgi:hypothetical protein